MDEDPTRVPQEVYRTLARKLDEIPSGFPATENGAELRFLEGLFTPDEALLVGVMSLELETAEAIAQRAGVNLEAAVGTLEAMAADGLVTMWVEAADGREQAVFGLVSGSIGFYGLELSRMNAKMARLEEDYFEATRSLDPVRPPVHRVIPVGEAVQHDVEIHPYEQAAAMIEGAKAWGVRDCICRTQQRLLGQGCDAPLESCLVYAPFEDAFDGNSVDRAITKDEALTILSQAEAAGLVHTVRNDRQNHFYICNCCTCCCGILRRMADSPGPALVARSAFRAVVDELLCSGCGDCVERCSFAALSISDAGITKVDEARCVGCGLCVSTCPVNALALTRRPEADIVPPPEDASAWQAAWRAAREAKAR